MFLQAACCTFENIGTLDSKQLHKLHFQLVCPMGKKNIYQFVFWAVKIENHSLNDMKHTGIMPLS